MEDKRAVCAECGKLFPEGEIQWAGRYPVCSPECFGRMVGVPVGEPLTAEDFKNILEDDDEC